MSYFLTYIDAVKYIANFKISNMRHWYKWYKENHPHNLPYCPHIYYKNKGWEGWGNFLGTYNKSGGQRKYGVNENYFKKWSCNMSYVLGLWFADGCMVRNTFRIGLNKKDVDLLMDISSEMDFAGKLRSERELMILEIHSKKIIHNLIKKGGKYRKSLDVAFPYVPKKYLPGFIRGLWDGDGSVVCSKKSGIRSSILSGNERFIDDLYAILKDNINPLGGSKICVIQKKGTDILGSKLNRDSLSYRISFGPNDTRRIRRFIYSDNSSLYLDRKRLVFESVGDICLHKKNFLSFEDAKKIVHKMKIRSAKEWKEKINNKKLSLNIPVCPSVTYKNKGWTDWYDWLGKTSKGSELCQLQK